MKALRLFLVVSSVALTGVLSACGTTSTRCNTNNCDGCCDVTGTCQPGAANLACGITGAQCQTCTTAQVCTAGQCVDSNSGTGGGSGTTGGGTGTGGGTTTGGGSGTTGGGSGGCDATLCPTGCCSMNGACVTALTPNRCGTGGDPCQPCLGGETCASGVCTACNGCIDASNGTCAAGTSVTACGTGGSVCLACDSATQACVNGACVSASCDSTNCNGCCDGTTCVTPAMMSASRCGQVTNGAACVMCGFDETCNSAQRACQPLPNNDGGTLPGFDGGFPSFDGGFPGFDGGVPDLCSLFGSPCMSGECCDFSIPMPACVARGAMCTLTGGVCQGSGVCQ